jgi:hypothetical protein
MNLAAAAMKCQEMRRDIHLKILGFLALILATPPLSSLLSRLYVCSMRTVVDLLCKKI